MISVITLVLLLLFTSVLRRGRLVFEQPLVGEQGSGGTKASHDHTTAMEKARRVESIAGL
jgi:hypothetical protein